MISNGLAWTSPNSQSGPLQIVGNAGDNLVQLAVNCPPSQFVNALQITGPLGTDVFLVTANGGLGLQGSITCNLGIGLWGTAPPASQPATPVVLADVIALLRAYGLSA